ncbi:MAG TPA: DM13 domain-containing protein [Acidimicrobiales bacterium]|nr:DM13 domain-containing protein [Acidimicrobiales bacterium]
MRAGGRCVAMVACLSLLVAACGGGDGTGEAAGGTPPSADRTTTTAPAGETTVVSRAAPRWETVTTLQGSGPSRTAAFTIIDSAIQWRVRWTCDAGRLTITSDPPPRKPRPVAEGTCPGKGEGFGIHTGSIRLDVATTGPWTAVVDQQIDTPLVEAPLAGMAPETLVGAGPFSPVEMEGKGTARLYELADGTRLVRFEDDFEVSTNTDLFVWLSEAEAPKTSEEAVASPFVQLGNLKSTLGSQNYVVPAGVPTDKVRSVVIWCAPVAIAYAMAPLTRS